MRKYDKVLFHPKHAIPVDLEPDNLLFVVPVEDVVAVFRRGGAGPPSKLSSEESDSDFGDLGDLGDFDELDD